MSKEWLKAASKDIILIEEIIGNTLLTGNVAFHAQQAVEKCIKAVLEEKELEVPKIHKLATLIHRAGLDAEEFMDIGLVKLLDELYTSSRYPGEFGLLPEGEPTLQEAREFYEFAKNVHSQVSQLLAKGAS